MYDTTDVLEKLSKTAGGGFMAALGGSKKFGGLDIKVRTNDELRERGAHAAPIATC